jgi:hypothetical protein
MPSTKRCCAPSANHSALSGHRRASFWRRVRARARALSPLPPGRPEFVTLRSPRRGPRVPFKIGQLSGTPLPFGRTSVHFPARYRWAARARRQRPRSHPHPRASVRRGCVPLFAPPRGALRAQESATQAARRREIASFLPRSGGRAIAGRKQHAALADGSGLPPSCATFDWHTWPAPLTTGATNSGRPGGSGRNDASSRRRPRPADWHSSPHAQREDEVEKKWSPRRRVSLR